MKKYPVVDTIILDGIDRCGKGQMRGVLSMQDRNYILIDRGLPSCIAYNKIYGREEAKYDLKSHENELFVHLYVDKKDWEIRCKLTNEPPIDYDLHMNEFCKTFEYLENHGMKVLVLNTSEGQSIYEMSRIILEEADRYNR